MSQGKMISFENNLYVVRHKRPERVAPSNFRGSKNLHSGGNHKCFLCERLEEPPGDAILVSQASQATDIPRSRIYKAINNRKLPYWEGHPNDLGHQKMVRVEDMAAMPKYYPKKSPPNTGAMTSSERLQSALAKLLARAFGDPLKEIYPSCGLELCPWCYRASSRPELYP